MKITNEKEKHAQEGRSPWLDGLFEHLDRIMMSGDNKSCSSEWLGMAYFSCLLVSDLPTSILLDTSVADYYRYAPINYLYTRDSAISTS